MNVLICCEESQTSTIEFRKLGYNAYSCDIQYCSGGFPEWHIQGDCIPLINGSCSFITCDGVSHYINGTWDLIIAHPPCTFLTKASACRMFTSPGCLNRERFNSALAAKAFFMSIFNANCSHICIENPVPLRIVGLPDFSQMIQPYMFCEPYSKKTYLWTKGLPLLQPTNILTDYVSYISVCSSSAKVRSKSFVGIAKAFASQYSAAVLSGSFFALPFQLKLSELGVI